MQAQAVEEKQRLERNEALSDPFRVIAPFRQTCPLCREEGSKLEKDRGAEQRRARKELTQAQRIEEEARCGRILNAEAGASILDRPESCRTFAPFDICTLLRRKRKESWKRSGKQSNGAQQKS